MKKKVLSHSTILLKLYATKTLLESNTGDWAEIVFGISFTFAIASYFLSFFMGFVFWGYGTTLLLGFAWQRIRLLGSLKKQLDRFEKENKKLASAVSNFEAQNKSLKETSDKLKVSNEEYKEQNEKFLKSIQDLQSVTDMIEIHAAQNQESFGEVFDAIKKSVQEQAEIQENTKLLQQKNVRLAMAQEKSLMLNIFFQVQNEDGKEGLNEQEFEDFIDMLPIGAGQELLRKVRFSQIDVDRSGVISFSELKVCIQQAIDDVYEES
mmetsp:Transcript_532/g.864  ORF Transcript_532/g.864 Transcript_532/m.864 type:complete len:265 (+) Transcript_532:39-833(+)